MNSFDEAAKGAFSPNDDQQALLNNWPAEGNCDPFPPFQEITPEEMEILADQLSEKAFEGKKPPLAKDRKATVLYGAPGSGKSRIGFDWLFGQDKAEQDSTIIVSYDELGAIFAIPEYQDELNVIAQEDLEFRQDDNYDGQFAKVSPETYRKREEAWERYRSFSQRIRHLTFMKALQRGYSVYVDTTSSGRGALIMINNFRKLGYGQVDIRGSVAPFEISKERIQTRPRPTSDEDLVHKRIAAMGMLPDLIKAADNFVLHYNPNNHDDPKLAMRFVNNEFRESNTDVVAQMMQATRDDVPAVFAYAETMGGDHVARLDEGYEGAYDKFMRVLVTEPLLPFPGRRPRL